MKIHLKSDHVNVNISPEFAAWRRSGLNGINEPLGKVFEGGRGLPLLYADFTLCQACPEGRLHLPCHSRIAPSHTFLDVVVVPVKMKPISFPSFEN